MSNLSTTDGKQNCIYGAVCGDDKLLPAVSSYGCCGDCSEHKKRLRGLHCCWSTSQGLLMDQCLWSRLPVELLERIIENLPIDAMLRARSVCKAWKAYISSYGYAHLCYRTPSEGPWCLSIVPQWGEIVAYDAALDKWHRVLPPVTAAQHNMQPFSTGANLVCFKNSDNSCFFVYNVLTKSCSALTSKRKSTGVDRDKVWIVTDEAEGFIVLIVAVTGEFEVFDSYSNRWSRHGTGTIPHHLPSCTAIPARSVSSDGILYIITGPPYDLVTFDTITKSWSRLYVPWPENSWNHILSEYKGRIYLLAFQRNNGNVRFCEWQLNSSKMLWLEDEIMPNLFNLEDMVNGKKEWQLQSFANRNLVILKFSCENCNEYFVLYNRALRQWTRISNLPTLSDKN